jgi:DNA mismatch repair protein MutL
LFFRHFYGFFETETTTSATLFRKLKETLTKFNINFDDMPSIKLSHGLSNMEQHVDIPLLTSDDLLQAKTHDGQIEKKEMSAGFSNYSQSLKPSTGSLKAAWDHAWGGSGAVDAARSRDYPASISKASSAASMNGLSKIVEVSQLEPASSGAFVTPVASHFPPLGFAMGCVQGVYLVTQNERGLLLVDIHAAHERILYEKLKKNLSDEQAISSQQLLIPHVFQASDQELATCEAERDSLLRLGFDVSAIGMQELSIRTIPHLFGRIEPETLVRDVLRELMLYGAQSVMNERLEHLLQTMACHTAVRAHDELCVDELNALLRQMEMTPNSGRCNHGRPTFYELPMKELDQWFSRGK